MQVRDTLITFNENIKKYYNILSGTPIRVKYLRMNDHRRFFAAFCNYNDKYIILSGGKQKER